MWYGHIPEPFSKGVRALIVILFFASLLIAPFFPPILIVSFITGYLMWCEACILAHPKCPSSYDEVRKEANFVEKWFIIISCSIVVFLVIVLACLSL